MSITLETLSGEKYQNIILTENDITYEDIIKKCNIKHSYLSQYLSQNRIGHLTYKITPQLYDNTNKINLNDNIKNIKLSIVFIYEYYYCNKLIDDKITDCNEDDIPNIIKEYPIQLIFIKPTDNNYLKLCKIGITENWRLHKILVKEKQNYEFMKDTLDCLKSKLSKNEYRLAEERITSNFNFNDEKLCNFAVLKRGYLLNKIPSKFITSEVCVNAVKTNGNALQFVPDIYKTENLCLIAVENDGNALQFVPDIYKTENLCLIAVENDGNALEFVPEKYHSNDLYIKAIEQNGNALRYVKHPTQELCIIAIDDLTTRCDCSSYY